MFDTNYTTGPSRSGDGDGGQRVRPSAFKDQDGGRRLATHFFTVPLQVLRKIAIALAHLRSCPGGSTTRLLRPASLLMASIRQRRVWKRTPAPHQSYEPTRGMSKKNQNIDHRRRVSDAKPDHLAFLGPGSSRYNRVSTPAIVITPIISIAVAKPWCPWCRKKHIPTRSTWYEQRLFFSVGLYAAFLPHSGHEPAYCTTGRMQLAVKLPDPNGAYDRTLAQGRNANCRRHAQGR